MRHAEHFTFHIFIPKLSIYHSSLFLAVSETMELGAGRNQSSRYDHIYDQAEDFSF